MGSKTKGNLKRWDLAYFRLPLEEKDGSVQGGTRLCMVMSNDINNRFSHVIHIVPLTCEIKKTNMPVHVVMGKKYVKMIRGSVEDEFMGLFEQVRPIDITKINYRKVAVLEDEEIRKACEKALMVQMGIQI